MSPGPDPKPVPLRIRLPYGTEDEFIEKYGSNVARGGVFIATRALKPEGTALAFEFVLSDGTRLLRGEGLVVKIQVDEGGSRSGMTVRFSRLDPQSKALIDRVIAHRSGFAPAQAPEEPAVEAASASEAREEGSSSDSIAEAVMSAPAASARPDAKDADAAPELEDSSSELSDAAKARRRDRLNVPEATAAKHADEDLVLGIDLGTTNCRVAAFRHGKAELLPLGTEGDRFAMPSMVGLSPAGELVVGHAARSLRAHTPTLAVFGAKRFIGRRARSEKVKELAAHFPFVIAPDSQGDAGVQLGDKVHDLPELYSLILKSLLHAVRADLGVPVSKAVLCVPAYFNDHQRAATREAGRLAGLKVLRIFNEPSAVALAFGYGRGLARKRILVYDLGGGTFDATVVELTGDDLEVVATGGDNFLGGMDFDRCVAGELLRQFEAQHGNPLSPSAAAAQQLEETAERAKIALSDQDSTEVSFPDVARDASGSPLGVQSRLTRSQLDALTSELVERTVRLTQSVLESGRLTPQSLDEVLLVGGQSRAPLVRHRIEEVLAKPVRTDVDAHAAVALGAAILGHALLESAQGKPGVTLSEVLSAPIGLGVRGGGMRRVLERNTRLPAEKTITVPVREGQRLGLAVFQGGALRAEENEYLGCLNAISEKTGELSLRFAVGADGTLELSALGPGGRQTDVTLTTADASEEVRRSLLEQAPLPNEPEAPTGGLFKGIRRLFGRG